MSDLADKLVADAAAIADKQQIDVTIQVPGRGQFGSVKPGESAKRRANQADTIRDMLRNDCPERKGGS